MLFSCGFLPTISIQFSQGRIVLFPFTKLLQASISELREATSDNSHEDITEQLYAFQVVGEFG